MCPDPSLLSIYLDGELPSPWKEKMESHLAECSVCSEKLNTYNQLHGLFKKDESSLLTENSHINEAKDRIWQKLESKHRFNQTRQMRRFSLWQRKLSVPVPVAAAAAVVLVLFTAVGLFNGFNRQVTQPVEFAGIDYLDRASIILAAEEEIPDIMPVADLNSVLQLLDSSGTDILIMRLPESRSFSRSGEPAILRAADYSRRHP